MNARLILVSGEGPSEYPLAAFNTIGRHPDNTVQVLDRIVSKEHCRITRAPNGGYVLRDIGSLNGSYVNGERVDEKPLTTGDEITLGNTVLRFEDEGERVQNAKLRNVTMAGGGLVQSQVRSRLDASNRFLPVAEIRDMDALKNDYEKLRIAHEMSQKLSIETDLDQLVMKNGLKAGFRPFNMVYAEAGLTLTNFLLEHAALLFQVFLSRTELPRRFGERLLFLRILLCLGGFPGARKLSFELGQLIV